MELRNLLSIVYCILTLKEHLFKVLSNLFFPDIHENGILEVLEGSHKINVSDKFPPLG